MTDRVKQQNDMIVARIKGVAPSSFVNSDQNPDIPLSISEDIVDRLRDISPGPSELLNALGNEGADEIERLRDAIKRLVGPCSECCNDGLCHEYNTKQNDG